MRTADLCSTCPTFTNALCVLYNGTALPNTLIQPLDALSVALTKIDSNLVPKTGVAAPATSATYLGQEFLNTINSNFYYAASVGNGASDWIQLSTVPYVTSYAQTLANISNNVVTDAASTTKYPSVNAIKTYTDQFTLTSSAIVNLTVANTVISHSLTAIATVTSPGSLAMPTSPVSGIKYIVWNTGVSAGVTINTTDSSVFFGQGGFVPGTSFVVPFLSIFSFTFINGSGWLIADLTISDSNLVITAATIGTSGYTPIRGVTQVTSVDSGGFVQLPSGANAYGEFIIWNVTGGTLNVAPTSPEITFGPRGTSSTTPVAMATAVYYSFKYVFGASGSSTGGWFVTALS